MLHTNAVTEHALELLKKICLNDKFNGFHLVGGTALALQIGHRKSIDLDFFTPNSFSREKVSQTLINNFNAKITQLANNTVTGEISGIKFDFIAHQYELLDDIVIMDGLRLSSLKDIAAMKVNATRNRGTKKDFVDIYFLLRHFSITELLELANQKYPNHADILTLKSLIFFDDAELQPDCEMLESVSWNNVKSELKSVILPLI